MHSRSNLVLRVYSSPDAEELARRWCSLQECIEISVFQSWLWVGTWLKQVADESNILLFEWSDDLRLVGLGLFCERDGYVLHRFSNRVLLLHDSGSRETDFVVEYNGLLVLPEYKEIVSRSLLQYFISGRQWSELVLKGIRYEDELLTRARNYREVWLDEINRSPSRFVDLRVLRENRGSFLQTLSRNSRYQLRKRLRQLGEIGPVTVCGAQSTGQATQFFDELEKFHQQYWTSRGQPGSFANVRWVTFHKELISQGQPAGNVQLLRITVGAEVLGYLYNLVHQANVMMIQSGFNYRMFSEYQPGYICNYLAIEHNLTQGMDSYDLLAGDSQYKRSLAKDSTLLYWGSIRKKTLRNNIEFRLIRIRRALSTWKIVLDGFISRRGDKPL